MGDHGLLADAYASARALDARALDPGAVELEEELALLLTSARSAWPGLGVSAEAFARALGERTPPGERPSVLHADDLYLTAACLAHDEAALALFDVRYVKQLRPRLARLRLSDEQLDELEQTLRESLLVAPPDATPRLAGYQGTGSLEGWLLVTATRAGLRLLPRNDEDDAALEELVGADPSPELAVMKASDHAAFKAAFKSALASLPAEEQNLLRQHYLDGLSIDRLGELHGTHRTSAARWLREAREALFKKTRSVLMKERRLSQSECDSLVRHAQSQLDVTLGSLLR